MTFQGALIQEQGVTFAIIAVQPSVLLNTALGGRWQNLGAAVFGPIPIVLTARDARGNSMWRGRDDIVRFLRSVPPQLIQWRAYTVNE